MKSNRISIAVVVVSGIFGLVGCAQRKLTITSNPPGALAYLNQQEVGRTPVTLDFTWYGTYDLTLRKDGYQTLATKHRLTAPWWQWVPIDLLAELAPWRPTDRQTMTYTLTAADPTAEPTAEILKRGQAMKAMLPAESPAPVSP